MVDLVKAGLDEGHSQGGSSNGSDEDDSGDSIFVVDQTQWGSRSPTTSQVSLPLLILPSQPLTQKSQLLTHRSFVRLVVHGRLQHAGTWTEASEYRS